MHYWCRCSRPAKTTLKPRSGKEYHQIGFFLDGDLKVNNVTFIMLLNIVLTNHANQISYIPGQIWHTTSSWKDGNSFSQICCSPRKQRCLMTRSIVSKKNVKLLFFGNRYKHFIYYWRDRKMNIELNCTLKFTENNISQHNV